MNSAQKRVLAQAGLISPAKIARLRALRGAATPGSWVAWEDADGDSGVRVDAEETNLKGAGLVFNHADPDDSAYIAAAHDAMPELLDAVESLTLALARMSEQYLELRGGRGR